MKNFSFYKYFACLAIIFILSLNLASAAYTSGVFEFEIINDNQAKITGCNSFDGGHLSIPAIITHNGKDYTVVEIGEYALSDKNISSIDIPEGIIAIDECALGSNILEKIMLPQSLLSLSHNAFSGNDLKFVNLPPNVALQSNTWGGQNELLEQAGGDDKTVDEILIEYSETPLEGNIAVKCNNLILRRQWNGSCKGIKNLLSIEGDNLTVAAGMLAYRTNYDESFGELPKTITINGGNIELDGSIIDAAYENASPLGRYTLIEQSFNIKEIIVNCTNLKLANHAFGNFSGLERIKINVSGIIESNGGLFHNCQSIQNIDLPSLINIKASEFQNCVAIESFTVPHDCRSINNTAFLSCDALKEFEIEPGDFPLIVGVGTFKLMPIVSLKLGRNVVSGDQPFYGLKSLKKLVLTPEITELEDYAFAGCTELSEIWCESPTPPIIHPNTFQGVSREKCRIFVKSNEGEYQLTKGWDEFFSSVKTIESCKSNVRVESQGSNLIISGIENELIAICSIAGAQIISPIQSSNSFTTALPAGTYIIVIGHKTIKYVHN